jgi:hypothetical protein
MSRPTYTFSAASGLRMVTLNGTVIDVNFLIVSHRHNLWTISIVSYSPDLFKKQNKTISTKTLLFILNLEQHFSSASLLLFLLFNYCCVLLHARELYFYNMTIYNPFKDSESRRNRMPWRWHPRDWHLCFQGKKAQKHPCVTAHRENRRLLLTTPCPPHGQQFSLVGRGAEPDNVALCTIGFICCVVVTALHLLRIDVTGVSLIGNNFLITRQCWVVRLSPHLEIGV